MGARRPQSPPERPVRPAGAYTDAELAAAIAAILAGAVVVASVEAAIREALAFAIRPVAVGLDAEMEGAITRVGASLAMEGDGGGSIERGSLLAEARRHNLLRRAHYALEATRRIAKDVVRGKTLQESLGREKAFFEAHRAAQGQREKGAEYGVLIQASYGDTVVWKHSGKLDYRPEHKRADGKLFRISDPPKSTNGLPRTLVHCECYAVPAPADTSGMKWVD